MKITIIGAGSASFSLKLIRDICLFPYPHDIRGINMERLEASYLLYVRYSTIPLEKVECVGCINV